MQYAVMQSYANQTRNSSIALLITFILGLLFLGGQFAAFSNMIDRGYYLVNAAQKDQSVAFFYVFVGLHAAHLVGAVLVLLYTLIKTSSHSFKPGNRVMTFEVAATFWHFLGLLWIYLFVFLILTQR
jgi:cytochrome c oxidase subunit 3